VSIIGVKQHPPCSDMTWNIYAVLLVSYLKK